MRPSYGADQLWVGPGSANRFMQDQQVIQQLKLTEVFPGPNPRKNFPEGPMQELSSSIKTHGVIEPIIVRPRPKGGHEIIAGERRWRASKLAGKTTIPAIVREMTDQQADELRLIENLQRSDLDELEEAEGYARLMKEHKYTAEKVAEKIGKKRSYVYGRLKLISLPAFAKEALREKKLSASIALLIARIPDPAAQKKAAQEIMGDGDGERGLPGRSLGHPAPEPMSERQASEHIGRGYMVRLKGAPFDPEDKKLLPEAGPCSKCPFRTGNLRQLYPDIKATDVCTKPSCFAAKKEAAIAIQLEKLEDKGMKIMPDKQVKEVFRYGYLSGGSDWIDLNDRCFQHPEQLPWKKVLGKHSPPITIARNPHSDALHELVPVAAARVALKKHKLLPGDDNKTDDGWREKQRQAQEREKLAEKIERIAIERIVEACQKIEDPNIVLQVHQLIALGLSTWRHIHEPWPKLMQRRGWNNENAGGWSAALAEHVTKLKDDEPLAFILEATLTDQCRGYTGNNSFDRTWTDLFRRACDLFKVDPRQIEADLASAKKKKK